MIRPWIIPALSALVLMGTCTMARSADLPRLPAGVTCEAVRAKVAEHGKVYAYAWARVNGDGKDNRKSANDALVVPLKPMVGLFEGERRSHVEGGAIFFIIVIGGLLTVLWLHQAQR